MRESNSASNNKTDAITELLAKCQTPSELALLAYNFGCSAEEIHIKAQRASSFGQFRMAVGNRLRGICNRLRNRPVRKDTIREAARDVA